MRFMAVILICANWQINGAKTKDVTSSHYYGNKSKLINALKEFYNKNKFSAPKDYQLRTGTTPGNIEMKSTTSRDSYKENDEKKVIGYIGNDNPIYSDEEITFPEEFNRGGIKVTEQQRSNSDVFYLADSPTARNKNMDNSDHTVGDTIHPNLVENVGNSDTTKRTVTERQDNQNILYL